MPELPEVEVVRRGLEPFVTGATITAARVVHPRAARHNAGGAAEIEAAITGATITAVRRRGKFAWLECAGLDPAPCLLIHLGMSGQLLVDTATTAAPHPHLRAWMSLDNGHVVRFIDQRTFGYLRAARMVETTRGRIPQPIEHIARDLLDPALNIPALAAQLKSRDIELKRLLLNQEIVSGIGNIYADEMAWAARLHPRQRASRVSRSRLEGLLHSGRGVMEAALAQGGTSFDDLYVDVTGQSGYFAVSLHAYGRQGQPCHRCGRPIVREEFMGRGSHLCPFCQHRY